MRHTANRQCRAWLNESLRARAWVGHDVIESRLHRDADTEAAVSRRPNTPESLSSASEEIWQARLLRVMCLARCDPLGSRRYTGN